LSRNKDRVGAKNINADAPPTQVAKGTLEGFSFVVPTEFVDLPSQGRYYPEGHPLYGQDTIEIRQMTAKEEDILTSRTLLKKGIVLDRVLQNIIVDKQIDAENMLTGDRNAILVAMRISGYGAIYETMVSCPSCGEKQDHKFDLSELVPFHGDKGDDLDIVNNGDGTFNIVLPQTELNVRFRLLTGYDETALANSRQSDRKRKIEEKNVTSQLNKILVSVNDNTSLEAKKFLIENIPSVDSRHLRLAFSLICPNIDLTHSFDCQECEFVQEMEVPLTADFFWPER